MAQNDPSPGALSPFHTPANGMPPPASQSPYGPNPGYSAGPIPPKAKAGPSPAGLLHALKRRWVLATFLGGLVAAVAATAVWMLMPTGKHQGKVLVQLYQKSSELVRSNEDFDSFRRDQIVILKNRDLITRTLAEPSIASLDTIKNSEDPIHFMEEGLVVKEASPTMLSVTLPGDNAEDLKMILDMLVKKYIDDSTLRARQKRDERMHKLEELANNFRSEILGMERSIQRQAQANNSIGGEGAGAKHARMQQDLAKMDADVYASHRLILDLESKIEVLEKKVKAKRFDLDPLELASVVNADPRVGTLLKEKMSKDFILTREREVANLKKGEPDPPTIAELKSQIELLDKRIAAAKKIIEPEIAAMMGKITEQTLKNKIADTHDALDSAKNTYAKFSEDRDRFQKAIGTAVSGDFNTSTLLKELEPKRTALANVELQRTQLQIEKGYDARMEMAQSPFVQMNLNVKQKLVLSIAAALGGFCSVLVVIGFLEWRTRRIDSVDQVVADLGMRVIGTVPSFPNKASLKAADAAGNANWRFVLNESINSTRTMLLHTARTQSMQVVMVTSATQGEGKTSLASQLGTSMATAGMRTLIVDCDLRNPSIHKLFDLGLQMGVSEVLCQEVDAADAVQPTAVPNLWVITAGQCSTRVISALAQGHPLESLFNRLRGQFDFIIVDSCPVLPVADALLVGQHVDGVLFSIMQDISQLPKVMVASEKLQHLNVPLLGAVVNNVNAGSAYYAYGYNYVKQLPA